MPRIWHYAPLAYAETIAKAGFLLPSNTRAERETPLLWFSLEPLWEPTAGKLLVNEQGRLGLATWAQQRKVFGVLRFGLSAQDSRLLDWVSACKVARTPWKERQRMEQQGRLLGANPRNWWACPQALPVEELDVQCFCAQEQWVPCTLDEAIADWRGDTQRQQAMAAMLAQVSGRLRRSGL